MSDDETNEFIRGMAIEAAKEIADVRAEYEAEIERLREQLHYCSGLADDRGREIERLRAGLRDIEMMAARLGGRHQRDCMGGAGR